MPVNADIHPHQALGLIKELIRFCGRDKINKGIASYKKGLQFNGDIYKIFLTNRHPWWELLIEFDEIKEAGEPFTSHILDPGGRIQNRWHSILGDAKKISEMHSLMTEDVRKFYRHTLVDDKNAKSHLFELDIAWHFLRKGHIVSWVQSGEKKPEFIVSKDGFRFCIECKRIGLGSYRSIRHEDFYRFCDKLLPRISNKGLMGEIEITLNNKLPSRTDEQKEIIDAILNDASEGNVNTDYEFGNLSYEFSQRNDAQVNVATLQTELKVALSPEAFGIIYTDNKSPLPQNPLQFICKSNQRSELVNKMFKLIKKAAKEQLDITMPGFISVFIPEISDFSSLQNEGGLPTIATALFNEERFNHVGCIVFNSDRHFSDGVGVTQTSSQALIYKNPNCRFELVDKFPFLGPPN